MKIIQRKDIMTLQKSLGDQHFQILIHHMFFLVGQFLELGKNQLKFFIRQIISHVL